MHTSQGLDPELLRRERNDGSSHPGREDERSSHRIIASAEEEKDQERNQERRPFQKGSVIKQQRRNLQGDGDKECGIAGCRIGVSALAIICRTGYDPIKVL